MKGNRRDRSEWGEGEKETEVCNMRWKGLSKARGNV